MRREAAACLKRIDVSGSDLGCELQEMFLHLWRQREGGASCAPLWHRRTASKAA